VHGFRIGKIHTVNNMELDVHLFFYQLDDKNSEVILKLDFLINFGPIGSKEEVQLSDQHQKLLFEKLFDISVKSFMIINNIN